MRKLLLLLASCIPFGRLSAANPFTEDENEMWNRQKPSSPTEHQNPLPRRMQTNRQSLQKPRKKPKPFRRRTPHPSTCPMNRPKVEG